MVVTTSKVISARWLARAAFVLVLAAVADMIGFADLASLAMVAVGGAGACLMLAGGYLFLAHRGVLRWVAFAVVVFAPVTVLVIFALHGLLWEALVAVALITLAVGAGRRALVTGAADPGIPSREVPPPRRAFLIMNPRSGGGKVVRFGLKEKAEALGAEVALLEGPGTVDVAALARQAVADGADLLGVAGGDGTQELRSSRALPCPPPESGWAIRGICGQTESRTRVIEGCRADRKMVYLLCGLDPVLAQVGPASRRLIGHRGGLRLARAQEARDTRRRDLTCRSFVPANPGNGNIAEFCDPPIDAQAQQALAHQTGDPATAAGQWAAIDHELADQAPWVPLYNPRNLTVLSARTGNYQFHSYWNLLIDQLWIH
jgi:putative intracellular protease/amidase